MWIRTVSGIIFIEVEQTVQGFWIPKNSEGSDSSEKGKTNMDN